jgi:hypothetical protein
VRLLEAEPASVRLQEIPAVFEVSPKLSIPKDLELAGAYVYPVRREEKEDPGLPLVCRELPATLGKAHGKPDQGEMRQSAEEGALRALIKASAGFDEGSAHSLVRWTNEPRGGYLYNDESLANSNTG